MTADPYALPWIACATPPDAKCGQLFGEPHTQRRYQLAMAVAIGSIRVEVRHDMLPGPLLLPRWVAQAKY